MQEQSAAHRVPYFDRQIHRACLLIDAAECVVVDFIAVDVAATVAVAAS